jgi:hypothetical protein
MARSAVLRETKMLEPTDKIAVRATASHQAASKENT